VREVGRRWHSQWDINVAARTKDWFAAIAASHPLALRDWSRPEAGSGGLGTQTFNVGDTPPPQDSLGQLG
jgi:hypothetical protein